MAASQHRLLLGVGAEAGGVGLCWRQRPQWLYTSHGKAFGFLARAQSSDSSSSQATPPPPPPPPPPQQKQEQASNVPSWAQPGSSEPPPWERKQAASAEPTFEVPYYAYLLGSVVISIAAVGSIFEYFNKKPVFGVIFPDNALYAPILGLFVFGGFPAAAFMWLKSIELANKAARDQDREDGFSD